MTIIYKRGPLKRIYRWKSTLHSTGVITQLNIIKSTMQDHLKKTGYVSRYDLWVYHSLTLQNKVAWISECDSLLKRNKEAPFLKWLVTEDEKWMLYNNVTKTRSWGKESKMNLPQVTSRGSLHSKKSVSLCIVGLQMNYLLWIVSIKSANKLGKIRLPKGKFENKNRRKASRTDQSSRCCVPTWQWSAPLCD